MTFSRTRAKLSRKSTRYKSLNEMPTWLLLSIAYLSAYSVCSVGQLIAEIAPIFSSGFETLGYWNWRVMFVGTFISLLALYVWIGGLLFQQCQKLLSKRWFGQADT